MKRLALFIALALVAGEGLRTRAHDSPTVAASAERPRAVAPDWTRGVEPGKVSPIDAQGLQVIKGRVSLNQERALKDARDRLRQAVSEELAPEIPRTWEPPTDLIEGMIREEHVQPVLRDFGSPELKDYELMYVASLRADLSPRSRAGFVEAFRRDVFHYRAGVLGGVLAFVLSCLAILAAYIRADEATKGYYTNRLRLAAAAGVGAAGVVVYQWLT